MDTIDYREYSLMQKFTALIVGMTLMVILHADSSYFHIVMIIQEITSGDFFKHLALLCPLFTVCIHVQCHAYRL